MCGARKHNQAIVQLVKTTPARKIQSGFKNLRMDFNSHDSLGRSDVHPGGYTLKETRRTKGTFVYLKGVGIVDELSFLYFKSVELNVVNDWKYRGVLRERYPGKLRLS